MNAIRAVVVGLGVAAGTVLSSGGAAQAANAPDYEGTPVVSYSIINAWPNKYTLGTAANPGK